MLFICTRKKKSPLPICRLPKTIIQIGPANRRRVGRVSAPQSVGPVEYNNIGVEITPDRDNVDFRTSRARSAQTTDASR